MKMSQKSDKRVVVCFIAFLSAIVCGDVILTAAEPNENTAQKSS